MILYGGKRRHLEKKRQEELKLRNVDVEKDGACEVVGKERD